MKPSAVSLIPQTLLRTLQVCRFHAAAIVYHQLYRKGSYVQANQDRRSMYIFNGHAYNQDHENASPGCAIEPLEPTIILYVHRIISPESKAQCMNA